MALYTPDWKYKDALEVVEKMEGQDGELVRYLIKKKDEYNEKLVAKNREMREVFIKINKLGS